MMLVLLLSSVVRDRFPRVHLPMRRHVVQGSRVAVVDKIVRTEYPTKRLLGPLEGDRHTAQGAPGAPRGWNHACAGRRESECRAHGFYERLDAVFINPRVAEHWGVGRTLLANSLLAAGGTLLVAFAERVWRPAVVGTFLVAAAEYRVQGVLTKVLRVRSPEWKSGHQLVPSGILGMERLVQGVLVSLVALADLLNDRVLLLAALTLASVQVVVLEYVGQAPLTWGLRSTTGSCACGLGCGQAIARC